MIRIKLLQLPLLHEFFSTIRQKNYNCGENTEEPLNHTEVFKLSLPTNVLSDGFHSFSIAIPQCT